MDEYIGRLLAEMSESEPNIINTDEVPTDALTPNISIELKIDQILEELSQDYGDKSKWYLFGREWQKPN